MFPIKPYTNFLFGLWFYVPFNSYGHVKIVSLSTTIAQMFSRTKWPPELSIELSINSHDPGLRLAIQYPRVEGIFFAFSGAKILPHSQWNLGYFFPFFGKKCCCFFARLGFSFSQHTHKLHDDVLLQFNGNSICNS